MAVASAHEDGWDNWSDGEEQGGERRSTAVAAASSPSPVPVAVDEARVAHYEGQIKVSIDPYAAIMHARHLARLPTHLFFSSIIGNHV